MNRFRAKYLNLDKRLPPPPIFENFEGGPGNDVYNGTPTADNANGNGGNDTLSGNGGDDNLNGGADNDLLSGGADNDILTGGDGDDFLNGGTGNDYMEGGPGNDVYAVDTATFDLAIEHAGQGNDTVLASVDFNIGGGTHIEYLGTTLPGGTDPIDLTGNEFAQTIEGNQGNNQLFGQGGNDSLFGFGGNDSLFGGEGNDSLTGAAGSDILNGGPGDDTYYDAHDSDDQIVEGVGGGNDQIFVNVIYFLAAGIEIEAIRATGRDVYLGGNEFGQTLEGSVGEDHLEGNGGDDTLIGGPDHDLLYGGTGNDTIYVDSAGDGVSEFAGEGNDRVLASVSYVLASNNEVEELRTTDALGTDPINLTGNGLAQAIVGNAAANTLRGEGGNDVLLGGDGNDVLIGGAGVDAMRGGNGDDTYYVDDAAENLFHFVPGEADGQGNDTVVASVSYVLDGEAEVETLTTTSQAGTAALALWGNDYAQSIFGNEGNNQLLGLGGIDQLVGYGGNDVLVGGAGIDYLRGGLGNDVYGIDENDVILENAGEGDDSLAANVGSYFLNDDASIETLSTDNQAGTFAQNLTGNNFAQSIAGSEGANVLNGRLGIDLLRGYGGADIFLFDTAPNGSTNYDVIADMAVGVDKIALQNSVFTGLAEGNLGANQFRTGAAAQDADDRILWDPSTNRLFYDSDGNGANAAILFAIVNGSPNLQASDFIIV